MVMTVGRQVSLLSTIATSKPIKSIQQPGHWAGCRVARLDANIKDMRTMISTSTVQEVRDQRASLRNPLLIARLRLECADVREVLIIVRRVGPSPCDGAWGGGAVGSIRREIAIAVLFDGGLDTVPVGQGGLEQFARDISAIGETGSLWNTGGWRSGDTVEGIVLLSALRPSLEQRRTGLVVWEIWLSRVGKQGQDSRDPTRRTCLAGRDHDAQIHEMIIEPAAVAPEARLNDVHILASNRVLDLAAAFSRRELGQDAVAWWQAERITDAVDQGRVRVSAENHDVADHDDGSIGLYKGSGVIRRNRRRVTGVGRRPTTKSWELARCGRGQESGLAAGGTRPKARQPNGSDDRQGSEVFRQLQVQVDDDD